MQPLEFKLSLCYETDIAERQVEMNGKMDNYKVLVDDIRILIDVISKEEE